MKFLFLSRSFSGQPVVSGGLGQTAATAEYRRGIRHRAESAEASRENAKRAREDEPFAPSSASFRPPDGCAHNESEAERQDTLLTKLAIIVSLETVMMEVAMATMNVSLPDEMKRWVEAQAGTGRYSNSSDVVRDLIRREQDRAEKIAAMQRLVDEGLASGISDRSFDGIIAAARAESFARRSWDAA